MKKHEPEPVWLGAEALPGGLPEIDRAIRSSGPDASASRMRYRHPFKDLVRIAVRWVKKEDAI